MFGNQQDLLVGSSSINAPKKYILEKIDQPQCLFNTKNQRFGYLDNLYLCEYWVIVRRLEVYLK